MNGLQLRAILKPDEPALNAMWHATFVHSYTGVLMPHVVAEMVKPFAGQECPFMLPGRDETGICAVQGDRIVGSMVFAVRNQIAYLWAAYVHPDFQGCGIGSALLKEVAVRVGLARKMEVRVLPASILAVKFYLRHGFIDVGSEAAEIAPNNFALVKIMSADIAALRG